MLTIVSFAEGLVIALLVCYIIRMNKRKHTSVKKPALWLLGWSTVILSFWLLFALFWLFPLFWHSEWSNRVVSSTDADTLSKIIFPELGQLGDTVGGLLGTLFAGFGLVGVAYSLYRQKEEQRQANYIATVAALSAHFTTLYGMDEDKLKAYDKAYPAGQANWQVLGKMHHANKILEIVRDSISKDGEFNFEKEVKKYEQEEKAKSEAQPNAKDEPAQSPEQPR
jgi:hypothetical protein